MTSALFTYLFHLSISNVQYFIMNVFPSSDFIDLNVLRNVNR